jgi:hypothetical protein
MQSSKERRRHRKNNDFTGNRKRLKYSCVLRMAAHRTIARVITETFRGI